MVVQNSLKNELKYILFGIMLESVEIYRNLVVLEEPVKDMNKSMRAYNECMNKIYCIYLHYKLLFRQKGVRE